MQKFTIGVTCQPVTQTPPIDRRDRASRDKIKGTTENQGNNGTDKARRPLGIEVVRTTRDALGFDIARSSGMKCIFNEANLPPGQGCSRASTHLVSYGYWQAHVAKAREPFDDITRNLPVRNLPVRMFRKNKRALTNASPLVQFCRGNDVFSASLSKDIHLTELLF